MNKRHPSPDWRWDVVCLVVYMLSEFLIHHKYIIGNLLLKELRVCLLSCRNTAVPKQFRKHIYGHSFIDRLDRETMSGHVHCDCYGKFCVPADSSQDSIHSFVLSIPGHK